MLILFRAFRLTLLSSAAAVLGQYMICCIEPLANITLEGSVEVLDRWHLLKNLRQSTEHVLEGNHAVLSKIMLPGKDKEKDALIEHAPVPRSSKEKAASAAYRNKMLARYRKVKKLHARGMKMLAICRATGMSHGAV